MGKVKDWSEESGALDKYWDERDRLPPEYEKDTEQLDWWEPEEWDERSIKSA